MLENPWMRLPMSTPFVLEEDAALVATFNDHQKTTAASKVHLELLPEPYLGNPEARVVLLNLNPGYSPLDANAHKKAQFVDRCRANLAHLPLDHPFFLLDPDLKGPGKKWWLSALGPVIEELGDHGLEVVTRNVLNVEYFPYHSKTFRHGLLRLPSQQYSFSLVSQAMERAALIIVMQGARQWLWAVPGLAQYSNRLEIKNRRKVLSRKNCPAVFEAVVRKLKD